jgi:hypothetical protein
MKIQSAPAERPHFWAALRNSDTTEPFRRLVPLSWRGELVLICFGMLLSFLVAGFW